MKIVALDLGKFNTMCCYLDTLPDDLLLVAQSCDDFVPKASPFGVKYETQGKIGREGCRPATVLVVWIVEENAPPRLVTAYPGNR